MWIFTPMVDNINQDVLMLVLPIFVFKLVFGTFSMVKALLYIHRGYGTGVAELALVTPRFLNLICNFFWNSTFSKSALLLDEIHSVAPVYTHTGGPVNLKKSRPKKVKLNDYYECMNFMDFFFFFVIVCVFSEIYDFYRKYFINIFHEFFWPLVFKIYYSVACCVIFIQFKRITMAV